jgi:hypothetical protein
VGVKNPGFALAHFLPDIVLQDQEISLRLLNGSVKSSQLALRFTWQNGSSRDGNLPLICKHECRSPGNPGRHGNSQ